MGNTHDRKESKDGKGEEFNFKYVKIQLKQGNAEPQDVMLERDWLKSHGNKAIPHFSQVVQQIKETEGVEITMNCNAEAFLWIISLVKIKTGYYNKYGSEEERAIYGHVKDDELKILI